MYNTQKTRNRILNAILIFAVVIGLILHDASLGLVGIISTAALLSGFGNVYLTTKRSEWFIFPDLLWIIFTVITLFMTGNFTDIGLYIFYFMIAFVQFYEWRNNKGYNGETKIKRLDNNVLSYLLMGFMIVLISGTLGVGNNIWLGAIISGLGITAAVLLAKRYYIAEAMFAVVNLLQIMLYLNSGLYQLALIPTVFLLNSLVFLAYNRGGDNG